MLNLSTTLIAGVVRVIRGQPRLRPLGCCLRLPLLLQGRRRLHGGRGSERGRGTTGVVGTLRELCPSVASLGLRDWILILGYAIDVAVGRRGGEGEGVGGGGGGGRGRRRRRREGRVEEEGGDRCETSVSNPSPPPLKKTSLMYIYL